MNKKNLAKQPAAVLFTGGKDSCLALLKARKNYDVKFLLTIIPKNPDSFMFHFPDEKILEKQAEMLGMNLIVNRSKGEKEKELKDLRKLLRLVKNEVEIIVVGGIKSNYQANRVRALCKKLGLEVYAPLWNYNAEQLWKELLNSGFKIIITKIACEGFGKEWLGRIIGTKELVELKKLSEKYKFDLSGEGGDFETAVLYMPGFRREININYDVKTEGKYRYLIKNIQIKK